MIDLSIVIVSYNTKEFLTRCLTSILSSIDGTLRYEIIVVDNASSDNSIEELSRLKAQPFGFAQGESSKLKIIQNKTNLGFSKANNIGVKESKGRYVLFLNPDTIVNPGTIEQMIKFMEKHADVGAATCRIDLPNGKLDEACHRGFPTPWNAFCYFSELSRLFPQSKLFSGYTLSWMDLTKMHEIDACAGAFMFVRKKAGEQVGWWDEDFFWYGEDLDFCYRLKQKGWEVYYVPLVSILHHKGVSGGIQKVSKHITTADRKTRTIACRARFEAMRIFYQKHYQKEYPRIVSWLVFQGIDLLQFLGKFF